MEEGVRINIYIRKDQADKLAKSPLPNSETVRKALDEYFARQPEFTIATSLSKNG